jgi:anthranilate synthase component 2
MLLVIDNYDSFTFNLVQYLGELGADPRVVRNDEVSVAELRAMGPSRLVISPGPCTPAEAGVSVQAVRTLGPEIPVLGVCLGHQAIGEAFGGRTIRASRVMHGKTTRIRHTGAGLFRGLPQPMEVARYHSLVTDPAVLPAVLEAVAWSPIEGTTGEAGVSRGEEIQAVRHRTFPVWGVQFHPESLFSEGGKDLLRNFLEL